MNVDLTPLQLSLLVLAGFLAGAMNVLAGGGSLLTLPLLLWMGLPAPMANASNRISLILQNTSATTAFARGRQLPWSTTGFLVLCAAPGAALGAWLAVDVDETWFRRILLAALLFAMWSIARKKPRAATSPTRTHPEHRVRLGLAFAAMGLYAGFLQAGLGFVLIGALTTLGGFELVRTNAIKVAVVLALQLIALAIFSAAGKVHWIAGLALAVGSSTGGWTAAHMQMAKGNLWVRRVMLTLLGLCAMRLLLDGLFS